MAHQTITAHHREIIHAADRREPLARVGLGVRTDHLTPRLHALALKLLDEPAFRTTEP